MNIVNLLIIDDHHLMIEGYKSILNYSDCGLKFSLSTAHDCESGFKILGNPNNASKFDLIFIDRGLPPFAEEKIFNGDDLAVLARKHCPDTKIVILTSHAQAFVLYNIVKSINPDGLLVKSDFDAEQLVEAVHQILSGNTFYSSTVRQNIRELSERNSYLDNYNRQIITLLAKGIKTKNLPEYLPLSISAIDKRKVQIRDYFNIACGGDEEIIREARTAGFI